MRKPNYGNDITFHWEGTKRLENVRLVEVASTLQIDGQLGKRIQDAWQEHLRQHPNDYDGKLWRFESVSEIDEKLAIKVSPITFSQHAYLRQQELPEEAYPNPLGITVLQVTSDGYAIAGEHFDGRGIVPLESRFIMRGKDKGITDTLVGRAKRETLYGNEVLPDEFLRNNAMVWGVITGSLHDTGVAIYVPVPLTHEQAILNTTKYKSLIMIPTEEKTLTEILKTDRYQGVTVADQMLGSIELLLNTRKYTQLVKKMQHA